MVGVLWVRVGVGVWVRVGVGVSVHVCVCVCVCRACGCMWVLHMEGLGCMQVLRLLDYFGVSHLTSSVDPCVYCTPLCPVLEVPASYNNMLA